MIENGDQKEPEKNGKPRYSIHDFKEKKRYTREEKEFMEAAMEFLKRIGELKESGEIDVSDFR